jgi:hypothetical protein
LIGSATVAVCALLVAGSVALADNPGGSDSPSFTALVACLNAHGVQTPATSDPAQFKMWLGQHSASDPSVAAALDACAPPDSNGNGGDSGPSFSDLITCLQSHGAQPPATTDPMTLKQWLGQHQSDPAVEAALQSCGAGGGPAGGKTGAPGAGGGPDPTQLRACLAQAGINVPDGANLKQWLGSVAGQAQVQQALRACGVTMARTKTRVGGKVVKVTLKLVAIHKVHTKH